MWGIIRRTHLEVTERYATVYQQLWEWGGGYVPYIFLEIDESDKDICQRGYGLWSNASDYPSNDEVYNFLKLID